MALITCPECGKQISDKAVACPGCGFPMVRKSDETKEAETTSEFDKIADQICRQHPNEMVAAIRELRNATGLDFKTAVDMMHIRYKGGTREELEAQKKALKKEKKRQAAENLQNTIRVVPDVDSKNKVARCPKCKSTSIQYTNKKLSLGRAIVGDVVAGPASAVLGGLSSKKGYAVCLNCGKRWKV